MIFSETHLSPGQMFGYGASALAAGFGGRELALAFATGSILDGISGLLMALAAVIAALSTAFLPGYWKDRSERRQLEKIQQEAAAARADAVRARRHAESLKARVGAMESRSDDLAVRVASNSVKVEAADAKAVSGLELLKLSGHLAEPPAPPGGPPGARWPLVLVVEDDAQTVRAWTGILMRWGFRTATAPTVAEATSLAEEQHPAWVLLDLGLGDGDGLEVLGFIRSHGIPSRVVVMTGSAAPEIRARAEALGAEFFVKPVDWTSLRSVLLGPAPAPADAVPSPVLAAIQEPHDRADPTLPPGPGEGLRRPGDAR